MSYGLDSIKFENGKVYFKSKRLADIVNNCDWESSNLTVGECENLLNENFATSIEKNIVTTSRWSTYYDVVFKIGDKFYKTSYSEGATEMQDESPYQHSGEWEEVTEVVPTEVVTIMYVPKGRAEK